MNGKRGARSQRFGEANVVIHEAGVRPLLVERVHNPDRSVVKDERDKQLGNGADSPGKDLIHLRIRQNRIDAFALAASECSRVPRVGRDVVAHQLAETLAVGYDDAKISRRCGGR